jgi:nucleoid-associated protein YgaU
MTIGSGLLPGNEQKEIRDNVMTTRRKQSHFAIVGLLMVAMFFASIGSLTLPVSAAEGPGSEAETAAAAEAEAAAMATAEAEAATIAAAQAETAAIAAAEAKTGAPPMAPENVMLLIELVVVLAVVGLLGIKGYQGRKQTAK